MSWRERILSNPFLPTPNSELSDLIWLKVMSLLLPYQWMTTLRLWLIEWLTQTFSTGQEKFRRLCSRWSHATATACCAYSLKISATKSKSSAARLFQCGSTPICQDRRPTLMMRSRWPDWLFLMPSWLPFVTKASRRSAFRPYKQCDNNLYRSAQRALSVSKL